MESIESFKKRCESIIDKAYQGGVTLLNFLDDAEVGVLNNIIKKHPTINLFESGKIIDADRKRYIISPYDEIPDFKIVTFEIIYNKKYYELNHRSILGSLMSLGIKRECIGDIVIDNDRCFFAATKEISEFLKLEFRSVGRAQIELKEYDDEIKNIIKYDIKTYFLQSLRLDSVISEGFNISRNESKEMIIEGLAYINYLLCQNPSQNIKENDIISLRHKGKIKLIKIGNKSKSGRTAVDIGRRI